ncbi:MAG: phage tail protein [Hyphomonas sp.]|uniref:phage tail protein n=1 Tax=Hyphomonas sp. TaxID=87 RepID=UPI001D8BEAD8|nr:tail fiber protein [Hyphomonas sp.]MBA4008152.1 phage tail protein [Erythrobacter sp.]MBA4079931.1 phage tail protein [Erythrobacter sp.]MBA4165698.1 phage tail protein [Erythrobacter sp.]MBA4228891.1 phage tail protein [Hyphomonas sp.]
MADPFIAEIRLFGFNFAPRGYAFCDGSIVGIAQNTALFALLGTAFGGDGRTTFGLPDLRGRAAVGAGQGPGLTQRNLGSSGGQATVALITSEMPAHTHTLNSATLSPQNPAQNVASPTNQALLGLSSPNNIYIDPVVPDTALNPSSITPAGAGSPHENTQPYLAVNFCIAVQGIFPPRA